jgi:RNA polymerase sigma factor (sigma-70 family)
MFVSQDLAGTGSIAVFGMAPAAVPAPRQGHDDLTVSDLVARARKGERQAWDALVERYASLIWSICRRFRLSDADADDVGQNVWLLLVDHLDTLQCAAALPGWLATTTRRECLRVLRTVQVPVGACVDAEMRSDPLDEPAEHGLLQAERHAALREAFGRLSPFGQQLMGLLIQDPPLPYAEISTRLGIPVGSIGPNRSRCLDQMRRHPAIAALINADRSADYGADYGAGYRANRGADRGAGSGRNRGAGRCVQRSVIAAGVGR